MAENEVKPCIPMPIKAKPYKHQIEAFNLACRLFGIAAGDAKDKKITSEEIKCQDTRKS